MNSFLAVLFLIIGYLCGSLSSAIIICKILKLPDPRSEGSKNPGATNVLRLGGKKAALFTLLGDVLKALIPVLILKILFKDNSLTWIFAGIGAFLGHLYPLYFGFKGGKGVATAIGVLLVWNFYLALIVLAIWIAVFATTRISSLSALTAAFFAPFLAIFMVKDVNLLAAIFALVIILIYRHKDNIIRLKNGEEKKFGSK